MAIRGSPIFPDLKEEAAKLALPSIPAPPFLDLLLTRKGTEFWLASLPEDGQMRSNCQLAFQRGYLLPLTPEVELARNNLGEIQRILDTLHQNITNFRTGFIQLIPLVYSRDKNGKLVTVTGAFEQNLEALGDHVKGWETLNIWKSQLKSGESGKTDAQKWFTQAVNDVRVLGRLTYTWINEIISSSLAETVRYRAIAPPTSESVYFSEYYETVYQLAKSTKPDIAEEIETEKENEKTREETAQFLSDYKWWLIGGSLGTVGLIFLWNAL